MTDATAAKLTAAVLAIGLVCLTVWHCRVVEQYRQEVSVLEWNLENSREHVDNLADAETRRMAAWVRE